MNINKCWDTIGVRGNHTCSKLDEYGHCKHCPEFSKSGKLLLDREIPIGFIDDWTQLISQPKEIEFTGALSVVVFRISNEWFALRTAFFIEVVELKPIHYVPFRTNDVFLGVVNINGELLMCMDLEAILEIKKIISNEDIIQKIKRMIVLEKDNENFVFIVDEFMGIMNIEVNQAKSLEPPSTITKSPNTYTAMKLKLKNKDVGLIDENKFFSNLKRRLTW